IRHALQVDTIIPSPSSDPDVCTDVTVWTMFSVTIFLAFVPKDVRQVGWDPDVSM
ncbi:hypothetical protein ACJMK2_030600, partial [Sinanodonta woodiana]